MGYSTPKKQLDLKEFLSQPAKKRRDGGYARPWGRTKPVPVRDAPKAAESSDAEK
ncbi:hypothetical protein [Pelagovum pacificum]|uniref:hypothetical protein n=1 Tax=Pelagovum pacificum TaxID=2588711 RepID=UPI0018CFD1B9|nr:hypothetical protein [Pelagovum pacificum]QQA45067.1 hypothetical protein I8N54_04915 [Pelagovum pacificum]